MISRLFIALFVLGITAGCSASALSSSVGPALPPPSAVSLVRHTTTSGNGQIQHVVVIIQENRSLVNFFAGFPGAHAPMYGYAIHARRRVRVQLHETTFKTNPDLPHNWAAAMAGWDKGKMDGFHTGPRQNYAAYAYMDHPDIAPYWTMAEKYVLADAMFPTEFGGSYASHIMVVAGNDNISPTQAEVNNPTHAPNDCDAPPQTRSSLVNRDRQVGKNGPFPCFTQFNTMAEVLDGAGLPWKFYIKRHLNGGIYSPFEAISYVRYGNDWNTDIIAPETRILNDVASGIGNLGAVTWVTPRRDDSDLAGVQSDRGPSWVASIVNEIGESKYWDSTAIIVVWDEWGGWYDNAPPPQLDFRGLGMRVPCLIISPYARSGYVSHTQYEWGSILKFIEEVFNLPAVGPASEGYTDSRAASLSDSFNFNQQPRRFTAIPSKYPASSFINEPPSNEPDDDE